MLRFIITLYLFVFSCQLFAISPVKSVKRSYIVAFKEPTSAIVLNELTAYKFTEFESLNPEQTIFKATYSTGTLDAPNAEQLLYLLPNFLLLQEDTKVELRATIPNDTMLSHQRYLNIVKAYQAWDLTRSGTNRRGDTIVIAVVDDGLHLKHPDFQGNIWINYADTAGNNKDDDGNGYIDDHNGWNFLAGNNDISDSNYYQGKHGTPVAGIIGATGNDSTGIAGLMWHVKLMIVDIRDTTSQQGVNFAFQSDVIQAYSYVLHQRKLYNATKGKKGAFVAAINSSWGLDGRFAKDAPIWCAFYDSLGKYGILTAAATSNAYVSVDLVGDLPTLCQSPHLIVVSNSNDQDQQTQSGYSETNVDLSAPGTGIETTYAYTKLNIKNGLYGSFNGTSAAAPMVTGAIGILHAYACEKLMDLIESDPQSANLLMRRFILEGVDIVPDLAGKNAANGRLNIFKSLQLMNQYCYGTLNIEQLLLKQSIVLFPNPGNGWLNIESTDVIESVQCFDITGKQVTCLFENNKIDITGMANGVYYFKITTSKETQVLSYVKQD
ncbi:MAG: S8 family serine peptidase [bacterium]|nr:S8 family serine peptidase [bacterium]